MPQSYRSKSRQKKRVPLVKSAKNTRTNKKVMIKKITMDHKNIKKQIDAQIEVRDFALQKGNLEIYAYSNKIIMVLLLQLVADGAKKSVELANKYSEKTGIEIPKSALNKAVNKLPTVKNTVTQAKKAFNHPSSSSFAPGWVWDV